MLNNFRLAFRVLLKSPAFTLVAVVTIALAIGANTAVFSLVNALLVRPLPYRAPSELVLLWEKFPALGLERIPVSAQEYLDWEKQLKSCEHIAAFNYVDLNLTAGDISERVPGAVVTPSLFPLLGVGPIRGRIFSPEEFGEGRDNVVVISERLWKRRFDSDPAIVGRQISLNSASYTVIGIMPAKFEFPLPIFNIQGGVFGGRVDIWKPVAFRKDELQARGSRSYSIIGRLKPGVSLKQAQSEVDTIVSSWTQRFPDNYIPNSRFGAVLYPLHEQVVGDMRTALVVLLAAVALVLLIACANLTTMLLARAGGREREFAIRVALGAGARRLVSQLLSESVLLALAGGAGGLLLAFWSLEILRGIGAQTVPRLGEVNLDWRVFLVTIVVSVGTGILFGLLPALASAKPELTEALKEGGRGATTGTRRNRVRNALVISEMALALVLLISGALLLKSFVHLQRVDPGFDAHHVLTSEISLPRTKYGRGQPVLDFYSEMLRRVKALPGVEAAALTDILPLSGTNSDSSFAIDGSDPTKGPAFPDEELRTTTPEYFSTLKVPLLRGRFFDDRDRADAPKTVIINEAFARKWFPNQEAIGKRITQDDPRKSSAQWVTIVGIVGNIRHRGLDQEAKPEYYIPHQQYAQRAMTLVVRSQQDPRSLADGIRRELRGLDPEIPPANIRTLEQVASDSIAPRRLSVVLIGAFAVLALVLAAVGIYGVMSFLVVQRTHELGVRLALGAQRRDVLFLIVGQSMKLVCAGTAIGLIFAFLSARALGSMLYQVGTFDFSTFSGVTFALAAVALVASYIPALRATRADPMIALSHNA